MLSKGIMRHGFERSAKAAWDGRKSISFLSFWVAGKVTAYHGQ
ncbi:hypothetical protein RGAI101_3019 [Roseobacter sp. GAI101]|nr:hypothetical protein RGAI101_3019 [Roseobacter sp. GAI101]